MVLISPSRSDCSFSKSFSWKVIFTISWGSFLALRPDRRFPKRWKEDRFFIVDCCCWLREELSIMVCLIDWLLIAFFFFLLDWRFWNYGSVDTRFFCFSLFAVWEKAYNKIIYWGKQGCRDSWEKVKRPEVGWSRVCRHIQYYDTVTYSITRIYS